MYPDGPAADDVEAAYAAEFEALTVPEPWSTHDQYLQRHAEAAQTAEAFGRGCDHRLVRASGPDAEAEAS